MVDYIFLNGNILTQDPRNPVAEAIAVKGNRIAAVGQSGEISALAGPGTGTIDLAGRLMLPGFTDCHFHFYDWALGRRWLDFSRVSSLHAFLSLLKTAVHDPERTNLHGGWILGQQWDESRWPENRMPTKDDLDRVSKNRPMMLWRSDLHLAVANSKALEIAGVGKNFPDPDQGSIGRDETGLPNGILQDRAIDLAAAEITCRHDRLGSLSPGKLADFVVLENDIYTINPARILDTQVDLTCVDGDVVYDRHGVVS